MASTAGEESLYICLAEDKQHLQPGICCPSPLLTEGLLVWQYMSWSNLDQGLIRDKEHNMSRFHRNTLRWTTPPVTELHSKRTPNSTLFCLTTCTFPTHYFQSYRRMQRLKNGHLGDHAGSPRWRLQYLRMWIFIKGWSCVKKINGNKCPLSKLNSNIIS